MLIRDQASDEETGTQIKSVMLCLAFTEYKPYCLAIINCRYPLRNSELPQRYVDPSCIVTHG